MQKNEILSIFLILIIVGFLSGCTSTSGSSGDSGGICLIFFIILVIVIIIIIALIAGSRRKTIQTVQTATSVNAQPNIVIHQPHAENKEIPPHRRCPECGRVIPDDAKLCPYCGKKFKIHYEEEHEKDNEISPITNKKNNEEIDNRPNTSKYCRNCGEKIEGNIKYCKNCGNKLI
jgi:rRNA maturation endonuclease Nob1